MSLIIPKKMQKGDTIGFISPSAGLAPLAMHRIEKAIQTFEELGYKVKIAKNALKNQGYVSGTIKERLSDIHSMFKDPEIKMIICTIGGNHSNQLIKHLNYDLIKRNPKIFIGYSDITVLHFAIQSQANLATYYGPCVMTQFGEYPKILGYTLEYFNKELVDEKNKSSYEIYHSKTWTDEVLDWFKKEDLQRPRIQRPNKGYKWLKSGKSRGEILGGTIPSINHLMGTKYWVNPENKIYFLDIPENPNDIRKGLSIGDIDSYLADLDNLGLFDSIRGLIIGRPPHYTSEEDLQLRKLIIKYVGRKKYPILYNANIGHIDPIITLRYGAVVELDSYSNKFRIV